MLVFIRCTSLLEVGKGTTDLSWRFSLLTGKIAPVRRRVGTFWGVCPWGNLWGIGSRFKGSGFRGCELGRTVIIQVIRFRGWLWGILLKIKVTSRKIPVFVEHNRGMVIISPCLFFSRMQYLKRILSRNREISSHLWIWDLWKTFPAVSGINRRNILNISRIEIRTQRNDWAKGACALYSTGSTVNPSAFS